MNAVESTDLASSPVRWKLVTTVLVASTLITTGWLWQQRVDQVWHELPAAATGDVESMQARLHAVEDFMDRYPLWYGSQRAMLERTRLSTELQVLRTEGVLTSIREAERRDLETVAAINARRKGVELAEAGEFQAALEQLEHALEVAPPDWSESERVRRDAEAIRDWLEGDDE